MRSLRCIALLVTLLQNAPAPETGTIQGIVTRSGSTDPISNAEVILEGGTVNAQALQSILRSASNAGISVTPPPGASVSEINDMLIKTAAERGLPIQATTIQNFVNRAVGGTKWPATVSDRDGHFTFKDVQPGRYTVRAARDGYFGKPANGAYPPSAAVDVSIRGKEPQDVAIPMIPGAIISGRIFDSTGRVPANVNVQVFAAGYANGFAQIQPTVSKATDDRGEYRLLWVPPGEYYVGVTPQAGPLAGPAASVRTFYPGVTRLTNAMPVVIRGGEDLRGIDIGMQAPRGFKISGQITSSVPLPTGAAALPSATLLLVSRELDVPDDKGVRTLASFPLTLSTAMFDVSSIPSGEYELFARIPDPTGSGLTGFAWGHVPLDVREGDVTGIAISVASGVNVKGSVRAVNAAKLPPDLRIVLLAMEGPSKIPLYRLVSTRGTLVEADGSFAVASIPPGRYRLGAISGLPQDFYIADVRQSAASVFDSGFEVGSKSPNPVEISIGSGAGVVEGVVQDGPIKIAAGATVALVPEAKRLENRALYQSATTDAEGKFMFKGVAPGEYQLLAWDSTPQNAHQNTGFLKRHEARARVIRVSPSSTVRVDLPVIR